MFVGFIAQPVSSLGGADAAAFGDQHRALHRHPFSPVPSRVICAGVGAGQPASRADAHDGLVGVEVDLPVVVVVRVRPHGEHRPEPV